MAVDALTSIIEKYIRRIDLKTNIVNEDEFENSSIRFKDSNGVMQNVIVNFSELVGRKSTGEITALSIEEVIELIGVTVTLNLDKILSHTQDNFNNDLDFSPLVVFDNDGNAVTEC